jgi:hypothetical protein
MSRQHVPLLIPNILLRFLPWGLALLGLLALPDAPADEVAQLPSPSPCPSIFPAKPFPFFTGIAGSGAKPHRFYLHVNIHELYISLTSMVRSLMFILQVGFKSTPTC